MTVRGPGAVAVRAALCDSAHPKLARHASRGLVRERLGSRLFVLGRRRLGRLTLTAGIPGRWVWGNQYQYHFLRLLLNFRPKLFPLFPPAGISLAALREARPCFSAGNKKQAPLQVQGDGFVVQGECDKTGNWRSELETERNRGGTNKFWVQRLKKAWSAQVGIALLAGGGGRRDSRDENPRW